MRVCNSSVLDWVVECSAWYLSTAACCAAIWDATNKWLPASLAVYTECKGGRERWEGRKEREDSWHVFQGTVQGRVGVSYWKN